MITRTIVSAVLWLAPPLAGAATFELMTRHTDGTLPTSLYNSTQPDVSADGRFVVFESAEAVLVTPVTNGFHQIFLHDRATGVTELVSVNSAGTQGDAGSSRPAISGDGCAVTFSSLATNLAAGDSNGLEDVFVRDRCAVPPITRRISIDGSGDPLTTASRAPDISADVRFVAFDNNGDIRRYDRTNGTSTLVAHGNFDSTSPSISADGARIAFWSFASDLVSGDTNGVWDIFLYDANGASLVRVSTDASGAQQVQGNEGTSTVADPCISGDGRFVAFRSRTTNLVADPTGSFSQLYVKDTQTGAIQLVSRSSGGAIGNADSSGSGSGIKPSLSADGKWVAFTTNATNLAPETGGNAPNIVAHNRLTGDTVGFTTALNTGDPPAFAGDANARYLAFFSVGELDPNRASSGVFLHDRHTAPIANAGSNQQVAPATVVTLDGSGSTTSANAYLAPTVLPPLQYTWSQLEGPTTVSISDLHAVAPAVTLNDVGTYRFQLVVSDSIATSTPSSVTITVAEPVDPLAPAVTVLSPNGGEQWKVGSKVTFQWSTANIAAKRKVVIALTPDGGTTLLGVAVKPSSKGSFRWKVSKKRKFQSDQLLAAICVPGTKKPRTEAICDVSNGLFSITR